MDNVLVAFMAGGGMGAAALVIQKMMERATTRKANDIAQSRLEMETREVERKGVDSRVVAITAEADRYRRLLNESEEAHDKCRDDLELMRMNCRRHGDLCQIAVRTQAETKT